MTIYRQGRIEIAFVKLPEMLFQRVHNQERVQHPRPPTGFLQNSNFHLEPEVRPRKASAYKTKYGSSSLFPERNFYPAKEEVKSYCADLEWSKTAKDYCQRSTLHGLRYVGDDQLHCVERLFWLVAFVLATLAAAYFITILYNRWDEKPMIISLSPTDTPLESIPFPAVTICNMNGARKSVAEEIRKETEKNAHNQFEKEMLEQLCEEPDFLAVPKESRVDANWSTIQRFMVKVSQPCHEMLVSCKWKSQQVSCNDIFNPELTDEGMCCSFNKVRRDFVFRNPRQLHGLNYTFPYPAIDWTPEGGYPAGSPPLGNPWRAFGAGKTLGLSIILDADVEDYYCSSTASIGFKMLLHNPIETPKISDFAYFLSPGLETRIEIIPRISTSTESLVNIPETKRQCVFTSDRLLRFYRTYTQRNCELECQSNFTLSRCHCVPFYLPKDVTTRICGTGDSDCVTRSKAMIEFRLRDDGNTTEDSESVRVDCKCLPNCVQIRYGKQMSSSKLDDTFVVKGDYLAGKTGAYYKKNMAVVHFFFLDTSFTGFEKGEIFGFTDFLSNTGGLLGLFLGFSFISAAEIAYYLTLRLFCLWKKGHSPELRETGHNRRMYPFTQ